MKATLSFLQSLIEKTLSNVWQQLPIILPATQKKMLLISILLTNVLICSFAQKTTGLLSIYDSCHVRPPQQTTFAIKAVGMTPMVRVAYVIPSNRTPQPNGVANLQNAIKLGREFFKEQMEQNGFGPKTFVFETEQDGVTPLIHVVHVTETDEYLRGDLWGRAQTAASNAGISLWAQGEVWVVIPETHVMFPDGSGAGGVALGAGWGSGNGGGVSMIGSNALPLFHPAMITDDTPYNEKVIPELGPYPMKQDVTFAWFEGTTFSSVASSWLGAIWHETGHAFGLGHDFRNDNNFHGNLMGNGLRGTRGTLFPEKYPQDYTRLEYWTALFLNVSHFFNSDKMVTNSPTVSHSIQGSVTPQQGLVHLPFQASDPDGLSFAYLVLGGDMAAEMLLEGTTTDTTFAVPYFTQGNTNGYTIFVVDTQGNKTATSVQFDVPAGNNQAPVPFIKLNPPVPGENQPVTLDATQSFDVDHDQSSLLAAWDVDNDGQFDTEPSTNKTLQYHYQNPGNYLIRVKLTDPAGAQTLSTAVSIKIPGTVAQVCQGDVTLSSQAEVDAFSCTEVKGSLTISGTDITNLNSLALLEKISGNLQITNNPNLETLELPVLDTNVGSISISSNGNLNSISGFNNLLQASSIHIGGNPKLVSISGFNTLAHVPVGLGGGGFTIVQNDALTNLSGFDALITTTNLRIVNNPKLLALDGFPSLTQVIGDFQISNNESLKTINGFNKLRGISGFPKIILNSALLIENNASLETLAGLSSLRFISAFLDGGHVPPIQGVVTVSVTGNPKLTQCCSLRPLLDALVSGGAPSPFVRINISGNGGGCTQEDILNCEKICDGDVTLTSQAEVDAFNCTKVTGNLTVTGADITRLFGLSSLREVYGDLKIENVNATSLEGLSLLDSIGGALLVMNNPSLNVILGLSFSIREGIEIANNDNLHQISGFNTVKKLGWLAVQNNPKLTSVFGFDSLEIMEILYAGPFGPAGIAIVNNDALTIIPNFQMLKTVGSITITGNDQLASLEGFPDVSRIAGVLTVSDNSSLRVINGFENLVSIVGISRHIPTAGLLIENNPLLEGFLGLSSLNEVTSDQYAEVSIVNNASLKNLDGLSSLTTFFALHSDKTLTIRNNAVLENIDSLSSLVNLPQGPGDTYINVTGNPKLTRCCGLKPLLDAISYYDPLSLHIDISQNGGGCTLQDILACDSQRILGYDIVDTSGKLVRHLNEGDVLYLDDLKCKGQTIVANTTGQIGSVKFDLNNAFFMMQNASPYTLTGDNYGTYFKPRIPQAGAYTLTATPYSQSDAGGVAGKPLTINFTVKPGTAVVSYDIVNTAGTFLRHLNEGDILFLDDLKANGQTIVANTTGEIGSVKFDLNNKFFMMQNAFPYTLTGDNYGTYFQPWVPHPGAYTLTATSYSKPDAVGCAGQPLTIHFMVNPKSSTAVVSYDIVNTSGKFVRRLNEGDILYLDDLKGKGQTIVANTTGQIGSVKFDLNNAFFMMQNAFPYTLTGDNYGTYFKPWTPQAGAYAVTATPYSKSDASGVAGRSLTIHLTVVDKNKEVAARMIGTDQEEDGFEGDGVSGLIIYPVPVDDELHVRIDDSADPEALVTICNVHGLAVYQGSYSKSQEINTSQLRAGVYFLQIKGNDGFQKVVKFIKN